MPRSANSCGLMLFNCSIEYMCLTFPPATVDRRLSTTTGSGPGFIRCEVQLAGARAGTTLDLDLAHAALGLRAHEIDMEKAVVEPGALHLDALGQHEGALELARRDAAMEKDALALVLLLAAHDELVVLDGEAQILQRETRECQRQTQRIFAGLLYVVRRIAVGLGLRHAVEHALEMIEPQQQRRIEDSQPGHRASSSSGERADGAGPIRHPKHPRQAIAPSRERYVGTIGSAIKPSAE